MIDIALHYSTATQKIIGCNDFLVMGLNAK